MVSEARKQSMAWTERDYSKHTYFRWIIFQLAACLIQVFSAAWFLSIYSLHFRPINYFIPVSLKYLFMFFVTNVRMRWVSFFNSSWVVFLSRLSRKRYKPILTGI